jgi:fructokinase
MIDNRADARTLLHPSLSTCNGRAAVALFGEVLADVFPDRTVLGGAPFNVSRHLRAFGLNPVLITRTGNDALRDELLSAMSRYGMETLGVQCDPVYPTGRVRVHTGNGDHRFEILPEQAYDFIHAAVARMVSLSIRPALVYFGTLAQRHIVSRHALKVLLRSADAPRFLDVNLRAPWYEAQTLRRSLQRADFVKLNVDEMAVLAETLALAGNTLPDRARSLMQAFGLELVLITCGAGGAWLVDRDGAEIRVAAQGRDIALVDSVGAGDGFSAVFILGMLRAWPMALTLERADAFAAALCEIRGAVPDHREFYEPFMREWDI